MIGRPDFGSPAYFSYTPPPTLRKSIYSRMTVVCLRCMPWRRALTALKALKQRGNRRAFNSVKSVKTKRGHV